MKFLKELFSENGTISSMRVMSIICCGNAIVISIIGITRPQVDYSGVSLLVSTFLAAAMGGKIAQKRIEIDGAKSDIQTDLKP